LQVRQFGKHRWVLVVDRGEEIIASLAAFLEEKGIRGGFVLGIGAIRNIQLGFFDAERKEYARRTFEESMELGSFFGVISCSDGKPSVHAHVSVSGPELIAFTGHLFRAEAAVSVELVLTDFEDEIPRQPDKDTGLKLIRFAGGEPKPVE
jgi:uncharacterized protein